MGISRSATVVCAYLIAETGMTGPASIEFVRSKRPIVSPNVGFRQQLDEYAVKMHGGTKEEIEMQVKLGEVPKNIRDFKQWMRGVMTKKKEVDPATS
jgi:protein-tyrosine phosphatase